MNVPYFKALMDANDINTIQQITCTSLIRVFTQRMVPDSIKIDEIYSIFSYRDNVNDDLVVIDIGDIDIINGTSEMVLPIML